MKLLRTVAILIVAALVVVFLGKNVIAKVAVEAGVKAVTGLGLRIQALDVGLPKTYVSVKGLEVLNPVGFPDRTLMDVPELYIDYDLPAILKGEVHLEELRLNMKELTVVRNAEGAVNVNSIRAVNKTKEEAKAPAKPKPAAGKAPRVRIDRVSLQVGRVVYKDYSQGKEPQVKEFNINLNEQFQNVNDPYALATLIITRALAKTTIASLANLDLDSLQAGVTSLLQQQSGALFSTIGDAGKAADAISGEAGRAVKETTNTLKKILGQ